VENLPYTSKFKHFSRFLRSDRFSLFGTLLLVFLLLVFKGAGGEGQKNYFNGIIHDYIEETSASMSGFMDSPIQYAEITSLSAMGGNNYGQGGQEKNILPPTIGGNSLLAHNPTDTNYIEKTGFLRSQVSEYTVQSGDLLSFIASDFGVSVNSIIWANELKDANSLSVDQVLKIPPVTGVVHLVRSGDTISTIALKYNGDKDTILAFNGLPFDGKLNIGDEIVVPDGQVSSSTVISATSSRQRFTYLPNLVGYFIEPTNGYNWGRIHGRNGVDIANSCGTPVYAAADGLVAIIDGDGWNGGFGKFIKLVHSNGTETLYAHLSSILVDSGSYAAKGNQIGLMGTTGRSTGCHLHFEVHGALNPLAKY
jgi:murein DD-endopeptidase MepM/ murein hydrolase activator NlpD